MSDIEQIQPTKAFPLVIEFELRKIGKETMRLQAGFRDWEHYMAYAQQMYARNGVQVRKPVEVRKLQ